MNRSARDLWDQTLNDRLFHTYCILLIDLIRYISTVCYLWYYNYRLWHLICLMQYKIGLLSEYFIFCTRVISWNVLFFHYYDEIFSSKGRIFFYELLSITLSSPDRFFDANELIFLLWRNSEQDEKKCYSSRTIKLILLNIQIISTYYFFQDETANMLFRAYF